MSGTSLARSHRRQQKKLNRPRTPIVHIGWCHVDYMFWPFMHSVLQWERYMIRTNGYLPAFSARKHAIIADSRDGLVRQFLEQDADWLFMLDPDIQFPPDTSDRLLELAHPTESPIIAGAYWNAYQDDERCLTWHAATPEGLRLFKRLPDLKGGIEIGSCGMGCTLIHRNVFLRLQEARPEEPWPWFGHDIIETSTGPDRAGEDVTFCVRAREAGFKIVGHCGVTVEHFKPQFMTHGN